MLGQKGKKMVELIEKQMAIDALGEEPLVWYESDWEVAERNQWQRDVNAIKAVPSTQPEQYWETCFDCPLSHGCPKIKGCTNEQAIEYASQIPNDCPLSAQPEPCEDAVSRQAAIETAENVAYAVDEHGSAEGWLAMLVNSLEVLPSVQPEIYKEKLNEIASALSEKFAYMNTCLNERDIILGYLGVKRCCETHCNTDCTNTKCESHPLSSTQPEQRWIPVTKDTLPEEGKVVIVKGLKGTWDFGTYRGFGHINGEEDIHRWQWKKNTYKSVYWWMYKDGALPEPHREEGDE